MEVEEYNIPVFWGHIAVKAWGNKNNPVVLAAHGIQDNAGIFDRIMPLLPKCFYYVCIDFPSHGKSSYFPTQMPISPVDGIIVVKILLDYLNRGSYILLGHSWGAHALFMFTQLYPHYVHKLCLIDGVYPIAVPAHRYKIYWNLRIDSIIKINDSISKNVQPPSYTYEEAIDKLIGNRLFGGITKPTAECLLKRSLMPLENGKYIFSTDPRLKAFLVAGSGIEYQVEVAKEYPIECPMLLIRAALSYNDIWANSTPILKEMEKYPQCKILVMDGNHDDFSNKPEPWASVISNFLCTERSKL